ncbi:unnamed protein product, partial [Aphanomyces euteiches]
MAEVELWCSEYGKGTVFPVTVDLDAKVNALQHAIVNGRFNVDPEDLTLYLARTKDGEKTTWLAADNAKTLLKGQIDK